ncbi:Rho GTPase activating protein [Homalodisca vitripennis]|nr:Rho GTPase activating protein [Homalodisca vitripennis]
MSSRNVTVNGRSAGKSVCNQKETAMKEITLNLTKTNSSTGSRSRSATPDSLDSGPPSPPSPWPPTIYHHPEPDPSSQQITPPPSLTQIFEDPSVVPVQRVESRRGVRRLPSAPVQSNLFRAANRYGGDIVASETADGIQILGYQRIGSVRYTFSDSGRDRLRSGSDPVGLNSADPDPTEPQEMKDVRGMTRSQDSLYSEPEPRRSSGSSCHSIHQAASLEHLGFEETWAGDSITCSNMEESEEVIGRTWVEWLGEEDLVKLQPLAFLELTVLLDQSGIRFPKRKPYKRKRKEDGPVIFGATLASLLEKDQQITNETHNVPLVFQKVLAELERRGLQEEACCEWPLTYRSTLLCDVMQVLAELERRGLQEEGLLRVASHKQKVLAELERRGLQEEGLLRVAAHKQKVAGEERTAGRGLLRVAAHKQKVLAELERRGLQEEGLLRVAAHKQKVLAELERRGLQEEACCEWPPTNRRCNTAHCYVLAELERRGLQEEGLLRVAAHKQKVLAELERRGLQEEACCEWPPTNRRCNTAHCYVLAELERRGLQEEGLLRVAAHKQKVLAELERRGLQEEGLLRVAAHKQKVLAELERRGLQEEGLLRVAAHKQKVLAELERRGLQEEGLLRVAAHKQKVLAELERTAGRGLAASGRPQEGASRAGEERTAGRGLAASGRPHIEGASRAGEERTAGRGLLRVASHKQKVLAELERRGLQEEGLLRVAAHKQKVLAELERRGLQEEGLLRVAAHKQKVLAELERRGLQEEGLLRVAAHKQKVLAELERRGLQEEGLLRVATHKQKV